MFAVSSLPAPSGLTVLQTVVRFGMPPTESIPAICQFALASRSAGRMPTPSLAGDASEIAGWGAAAADPVAGGSEADSATARNKADLMDALSAQIPVRFRASCHSRPESARENGSGDALFRAR